MSYSRVENLIILLTTGGYFQYHGASTTDAYKKTIKIISELSFLLFHEHRCRYCGVLKWSIKVLVSRKSPRKCSSHAVLFLTQRTLSA